MFKIIASQKATHRSAVLQALFVTFLWATSWVLIKIGLADIPALSFAGLRYTFAFMILLPFFLRSPERAVLKRLDRRQWAGLLLLGLLYYTLTQGAQFLGLAYMPAVTVNILLSFTTIIVALSGMVLLHENLALMQWGGILLSILGAMVYFYPVRIPASQTLGWIAVIVGVLANAGSAVLGRSINRRADLSSLTVTVTSMGFGGLLLLVMGILVQGLPHLSWLNWLIVAWLSLVNTAFAFTLWNLTQRTLSAAESSIINNTMMVQIPVLAVLFLGETLDAKQIIGMGITLLGVVAVQYYRKK